MVIDISQNLLGCRVFDGDTPPTFKQVKSIEQGYRLTDVNMCLHNGTHIDAPSHYIADGETVERTPLEYCYGKCQVVDCHALNKLPDTDCERVLLNGGRAMGGTTAQTWCCTCGNNQDQHCRQRLCRSSQTTSFSRSCDFGRSCVVGSCRWALHAGMFSVEV